LRLPTFGDYAVAHPDPSRGDVDPKVMSISAGLRYTIDDEWLVAKGGLYKATGGRSLGGEAAIPVAGVRRMRRPSLVNTVSKGSVNLLS
jgi:Beta protein